MSRAECPREQEVLDALASNRWPDRLSDDLANHVAGCAFCKDLGLVAEAFGADFSSALDQARIPSAGLVWWRAEIRSRQESLRAASRPITWAHSLGAAGAIAIALVLLTLVDFGNLKSFSLSMLVNLIPDSMPLPLMFATLGALAILASVTLYFVLSDK